MSKAFRSVADAVARGSKIASDDAGERSRLANRLRSVKADFDARRAAGAKQTSEAKRAAEAVAREDIRAANAAANERRRITQRLASEERRIRAEIARDKAANGGEVSGRSAGAIKRLGILESVRSAPTANMHAALEKVTSMRMLQAAQRQGEQDANRLSNAQSRAAERAARAQMRATRLAEQEEARARAKGVREEDAAARRRDAIRTRSALMAGRLAAKQAAEEQRHAEQRRKQFNAAVSGVAGGATRSLVSGGVGLARAALQLGGGFSIMDAVQERVNLRGELADIANRGVVTRDQAGGSTENATRRSVDELQARVSMVSSKWAIAPEQAAAGLDKFGSKTGNLTRGLELMDGLAEMSRAGAGSLDNLADAAGDVFNADKTQNAQQVLAVMRALSAQGKIGAVEMKDLASQMASLGAAAGRFQGDAGKNMAMMGGLAQLSRESGGSKSASQATTAVTSLTNQLYKNKRIEGFQDLGVEVKDQKTGLNRDLDKILIETLQGAERKSRESGHGMADFDVNFGTAVADAQARRATTPLEKAYKEAGGGEAGTKAAQALLAKFAGATTTKEEVAGAAQQRMQEADVQFQRTVINLKNSMATELLPALVRIIPEFTKLVPFLGEAARAVSELAGWFTRLSSSNPFGGLGAAAGLAITAELAKAGIGKIIEASINKQMGAVGMAGLAIATAYLTIQQLKEQDDQQQNRAYEATIETAQAKARLKRGDANAFDLSSAEAAKGKLEASIKETEANKGGNEWFQKAAYAGALITDATTWGSAGATKRVKAAEAERRATDDQQLSTMKKDLSELSAAIKSATKSINDSQGGGIASPGAPQRNVPMSHEGRSGGP